MDPVSGALLAIFSFYAAILTVNDCIKNDRTYLRTTQELICRLETEKILLTRWGEAVGLSSVLDLVNRRPSDNLHAAFQDKPTREGVIKTLTSLYEAFQEANVMIKKYCTKRSSATAPVITETPTKHERIVRLTNLHPSADKDAVFEFVRCALELYPRQLRKKDPGVSCEWSDIVGDMRLGQAYIRQSSREHAEVIVNALKQWKMVMGDRPRVERADEIGVMKQDLWVTGRIGQGWVEGEIISEEEWLLISALPKIDTRIRSNQFPSMFIKRALWLAYRRKHLEHRVDGIHQLVDCIFKLVPVDKKPFPQNLDESVNSVDGSLVHTDLSQGEANQIMEGDRLPYHQSHRHIGGCYSSTAYEEEGGGGGKKEDYLSSDGEPEEILWKHHQVPSETDEEGYWSSEDEQENNEGGGYLDGEHFEGGLCCLGR